jgi:Zn-dependent peptidase ImmA (M78 family)
MNYGNFIAPYLDNVAIAERVEVFRKDFWNNNIPVEIEDIIELRLKMDVIPVPGFLKFANMDALIASDWKHIYVDKNEYLDDHHYNRLRFSLAHEIGHFSMHKEIYSQFQIKDIEDYYKLYKNIPERQYWYLESQANKFASYLLVPQKTLSIKMEKELEERDNSQLKKIDRKLLNSYLAKPLAKIFKVSEEVVNHALDDLTP